MSRKPGMLGDKKKRTKRQVSIEKLLYDPRMFNAIIYGHPRTGKTVTLANLINEYMGLGFNCFLNDCAKGYDLEHKTPKSEILMYFSDLLENIKGVRIFVPPGCVVDIPTRTYKMIEVDSYDTLFNNMKPDKLNIISFDSFVLPPLAFARFYALLAIELLYRSKRNQLITPIVGAIDQINHVFPSSALRFSGIAGTMQDKAANWFARFLMDCSGSGIKFLATSHGITQIKKVVRMNFHWKLFKAFSEDISLAVSRIKPMQKLIENLAIEQIYATDDQSWGDIIPDIPDVPFAPEPVYYSGKLIKNPFWLLESEHKGQVLTPGEYRKEIIQGNGDNGFTRKVRLSLAFLAGKTYKQLAREYKINPATVANWLNELREMEEYAVLEEYRRDIRDLFR